MFVPPKHRSGALHKQGNRYMNRKTSIIRQLAIIFVLGIFLIGILTFLSVQYISARSVDEQTTAVADSVTNEVKQAVTEYPAHPFLLLYWYEHAREMELEYDATYEDGAKTELQCRIWYKNHPDMPLDYVTEEQIEALPAEDQRIFAEIMYSRVITRLNQIKASSDTEFLFVVLTDDSYKTQFFLLSAADPGAERGTEYEQVYTLGVQVEVDELRQESMRLARENQRNLTEADNYVDYYTYLEDVGDKIALIGLTYSQGGLEDAKMRETMQNSMWSVLFEILLAAVCLTMLFFLVIRPLRKVQDNIREYKNSKDSRKVIEELKQIRSNNEIGALAEDVSTMAEELDVYMDRIQEFAAENERIGAELNLASRIQLAMLPMIFPPFPEHDELDIYATMIPAKEVGGDFYDFFMVDENHLALVMADVSGKGVPAALFMTITKVLLQNELLSGKDPATVLETLNERICRNNTEEMFVTVWLGILDLKTGVLTCSNAGHEYPVLRQPGGHFEILKDKHGFVVGGMPGMKYTNYTIEMQPGSKLFVYTDGVPEAERSDRKQFGLERTVTMLRRFEDLPPQSIVTGMSSAVYDFVGEVPQFDDLTMLVLHYKGRPSDGQS